MIRIVIICKLSIVIKRVSTTSDTRILIKIIITIKSSKIKVSWNYVRNYNEKRSLQQAMILQDKETKDNTKAINNVYELRK